MHADPGNIVPRKQFPEVVSPRLGLDDVLDDHVVPGDRERGNRPVKKGSWSRSRSGRASMNLPALEVPSRKNDVGHRCSSNIVYKCELEHIHGPKANANAHCNP